MQEAAGKHDPAWFSGHNILALGVRSEPLLGIAVSVVARGLVVVAPA